MIKTLLIDLIDTVIRLPFKPRDILYKPLKFSDSYEFEYIAYSICQRSPGLSIEEFFEKLIKETRINNEDNQKLSNHVSHVWKECIEKSTYLNGVPQVLNTLKERGYKLAIVSNTTPPTWGIIRKLKLRKFFDSIILSCDVGILKPDPEIFKIAIKSVNGFIEDSCMIGDKWITDMVGALKVGIKGIFINYNPNSFNLNNRSKGIIASIPSIKYLPKILETVNKPPVFYKS